MAKDRMADRLLSDLGADMGIEDLAFDESDSCLLQFDDKTTVLVLYEGREDVLYLFSYVGVLLEDKDKANKLLMAMMSANYRWKESGGGTLSMRPGDNDVVLTRKMSVAATDIDKLKAAISEFVVAEEKWAAVLLGKSPPPSVEGMPSSAKQSGGEAGKAPPSPSQAIRA